MDPDRRTLTDATHDETARLEVLQPSREDFVAHAMRPITELVEPQWAALEQPEEERRPRSTENVDGSLKSPAAGVERSCHLARA